MSRSNALEALVREVADNEASLAAARDGEDLARQESTAARLALDSATAGRERVEQRVATTRAAAMMIAERDEIAPTVVQQMIDRASR